MSWRGWMTLVLLAAAIVSGWSVWMQRDNKPVAVTYSTRPSYLLRTFDLVALDGLGKQSFTLRAPELAQDPNDKTMLIQTPLFLVPDKDGKAWEVRSRTGWVAADNSELRLRGNVVANSPPGVGSPTTMKSEEMNVFPDTKQATSAVRVDVTGPGSTMQGTGMKADLATKRVQLLSKVTMVHDPKRR